MSSLRRRPGGVAHREASGRRLADSLVWSARVTREALWPGVHLSAALCLDVSVAAASTQLIACTPSGIRRVRHLRGTAGVDGCSTPLGGLPLGAIPPGGTRKRDASGSLRLMSRSL